MSATATAPREIRREEYQVPDWLVDTVSLTFDLAPTSTKVMAKLTMRANPARSNGAVDQVTLDGEGMKLLSVKVDGADATYQQDATSLRVSAPGDMFVLETSVEINPEANKALEGLYLSNGKFCTQCEAEGFRKITYFPDRPDVMAVYEVEIRAPKEGFPVLLSNGNLVASGALDDGRHFARWHDPHRKPSYLFALVAGDLACFEDKFTTASGRDVRLCIYVEHGNEDRCAYAMDSLIRSMRWDEEVYGLEYDLDLFNIVAVSDFNMGAMENKSLNIFNAKYVLAKPETATDNDYAFIESIVAHEYFHNWTGNRVTCRDWFQLSLKEGLTVFRDQEFSADQRSRAVQRIDQVNGLRGRQFPEDAGPLAHPVRPDSYMEINNFYTPTVYDKGAEVIRMIHKLIGAEAYRRGIDLYFERHDGTAATCDDFAAAMADASGVDLDGFKRWYAQAGTPKLSWSGAYDADQRSYTLTVTQQTEPTPGQPEKLPLVMPLPTGLLAQDGTELASQDLVLEQAEQVFIFSDIAEAPAAVSLNRGFASPVIVETRPEPSALALLMAHDTDPFNRYEAWHSFAVGVEEAMIAQVQAGENPSGNPALFDAMRSLISDPQLDAEFRSTLLRLPGPDYLAERMSKIDVDAITRAYDALRRQLAEALKPELDALILAHPVVKPVQLDAASSAARSLRNQALGLLAELGEAEVFDQIKALYAGADNMTDRIAALGLLNGHDVEADAHLADFHQRHAGDEIVIDKWFTIQAVSRRADVLDRVEQLATHPDFNPSNPNRFRSLVGALGMANMRAFHHESGRGYRFIADKIIAIDAFNPQVAARMAKMFGNWKRFDDIRADMMKEALVAFKSRAGVSRDLLEVAVKSLDG